MFRCYQVKKKTENIFRLVKNEDIKNWQDAKKAVGIKGKFNSWKCLY